MVGWAQQRVQDHVPTMDDRLMKLILKGDPRTVGSILNNRSSIQICHVVVAALKRAGLGGKAADLEGQLQQGNIQRRDLIPRTRLSSLSPKTISMTRKLTRDRTMTYMIYMKLAVKMHT